MKNTADFGECYPPRPSASVDNTLLDLQNSSYPTQPDSIIVNYYLTAANTVQIIIFSDIVQLFVQGLKTIKNGGWTRE